MRILRSIMIGAVAWCASQVLCIAATPQLTANDLATTDGSCRVGLHGDLITCILTAIETRVELSPDVWTGDEESKNWTDWLTNFDDDLYSRWVKNAPVDGQETVFVRIADGAITVTNNTFLQPNMQADSTEAKAKFEAAIVASLEQTLKAAGPMPQTKNKLKEIRTKLTFMRDPKVVPRYGKTDYGFAVARGSDGFLVAYGRTKLGRSTGIQIISEPSGGSIQVTEMEPFLQKVAEIEKTE